MPTRKVPRVVASSVPIPVSGKPASKRRSTRSTTPDATSPAPSPRPDFAEREMRQSPQRRIVGTYGRRELSDTDTADLPDVEPTDPV